MTADVPELRTLAARLEVLADRLAMLEVQVRALMESPTVDAKEFILRDDRGGGDGAAEDRPASRLDADRVGRGAREAGDKAVRGWWKGEDFPYNGPVMSKAILYNPT